MATTNEILRDLNLRHEIRIRRYSGAVLQKMLATLKQADKRITAQIAERISQGRGGTELTAHLESVLNEVKGQIASVSQELEGQLRGEMVQLGEFELDWQSKAINLASPVEFVVNRPPLEFIRAAAISRPFQGKLLAEHFRDMDAARFAAIRGHVRQAVIDGAAVPQITRQLAELLDGNRRWAEAVARTAINHIVTSARDELYSQNADIIKKWQFVATLDGRTTLTCISLDGTTWPLGKGPRPPRHINCRSTTIPITKSWEELGFDKALDDELAANAGKRPFVRDTRKVKDIPKSERDQLIGQVPSHMTYGEWLKSQPPSFQDEVLGPTRGRLFREGKLPVQKFTDDYGEVYLLDELRRRETAAFRRAGLGDDGRFRRFSAAQRFEAPELDPTDLRFEAPLTPGQIAASKATLTRFRGELERTTDPARRAILQQKIADVEKRLGVSRVVEVPPTAPPAAPPTAPATPAAPPTLSKGQIAAVKATISRMKREFDELDRADRPETQEKRASLLERIAQLERRLAGADSAPPPRPAIPPRAPDPDQPLKDAGFTDSEIRAILSGDPEVQILGQRAREGWAYLGGDFQPVTPELVEKVRRMVEADKTRLRRSLETWEKYNADKAETDIVSSVLSDGRPGIKREVRADFLHHIEQSDELVRKFERQLARRPQAAPAIPTTFEGKAKVFDDTIRELAEKEGFKVNGGRRGDRLSFQVNAYENGKQIGFAGFEIELRDGQVRFLQHDVSVSPEAEGKGLGTRLLRVGIEAFRRAGAAGNVDIHFNVNPEFWERIAKKFPGIYKLDGDSIVPKPDDDILAGLKARLARLEADVGNYRPANRLPVYKEIDMLRRDLGLPPRTPDFGLDEDGVPLTRYSGVRDSARVPKDWAEWKAGAALSEQQVAGTRAVIDRLIRDTVDAFGEADPELKLFLARMKQLATGNPVKYDLDKRGTAYWEGHTRTIKVPAGTEAGTRHSFTGARQRTVAHEMSHWMDEEAGNAVRRLAMHEGETSRSLRSLEKGVTLRKEVMDAMKADQERLRSMGDPNTVLRVMRQELLTLLRSHDSIQLGLQGAISEASKEVFGQLMDWAGAITNNKIGAGHSLSYYENWTRSAKRALPSPLDYREAIVKTPWGEIGPGNVSEAFAQYGSTRSVYARYLGLEDFVRKYFPNTVREFDRSVTRSIVDAESVIYGAP